MFRKAIIVVLTLAAVGTGGIYVASIWVVCGLFNFAEDASVAVARGALAIVLAHLVDPQPFECIPRRAGRLLLLPKTEQHGVLIPLWIPLLVFATYPTIALIRGPLLRRRRRRKRGLCVKCGYDLTGNVTGVCSECGREV